jgi:hypothetical protein
VPRVRSHWAILGQVRRSLAESDPLLAALIERRRADFYAGGVAPDALRLFAGRDKHSSHFYDDQRPDTWDLVLETLAAAHPAVADPSSFTEAQRAWLAGYLAHVQTDVAYWRIVLSCLPPFPEHASIHHGAWMLADGLPLPPEERTLDLDAVDFASAPPWVDEPAVRRLLERMTGRLLLPDSIMATELAYTRGRPDTGSADDRDLLRQHAPAWEAALAQARARLPATVWQDFQQSAVAGSVALMRRYLGALSVPGSDH